MVLVLHFLSLLLRIYNLSNIKNQMEMEQANKKLTVWTTLLGDFNKEGLRAHAPIKLRRRHPQYMAFNMNY